MSMKSHHLRPLLPAHAYTHTHMKIFSENLFFNSQSGSTSSAMVFGKFTLTTWQSACRKACIGRKFKKHRNKQQLRVEFSFWPPVEGNSMLRVKLGDWWCSDHWFPSIPQAEAQRKTPPPSPHPPIPHPGCVNQHPHWYHGKNPQNPFKLLYLNITNIPCLD